MIKQVFSDEWNCNNAGGCRNFGTFDVNPAYCIRVKAPNTLLFFRLMIKSETSENGMSVITNPSDFKQACAGQLYRIQATNFPIQKDSLTLSKLREPILETHGGTYTSSLSSCITPCLALEAGCYILVVSTFDPQRLAKYDLAVYSNQQVDY